MPNWSDDEGRCHYSVNGVPCYQSPVDKCPAHGGMARVKRDECEHGSLRRKCQRCADRTELDELRAEVERLREALEVLVAEIEAEHDEYEKRHGERPQMRALQQARAAIAKARGEP